MSTFPPVLSARFYAGGSERSGQQIVGPPRKKSPNELVEDLFKGAKEHGAVAVDRTAKSGGETSKPKVRSSSFCSLFQLLWSPGIVFRGQQSLGSFSAAPARVSQWQEKALSCAVGINLLKLVTVPAG